MVYKMMHYPTVWFDIITSLVVGIVLFGHFTVYDSTICDLVLEIDACSVKDGEYD